MMFQRLFFVAGAPASGKSTVLEVLLTRPSPFVFFDIDWLAGDVSTLLERDVRTAPETWPFYNALWLSVLRSTLANRLLPVLFTPTDPSDFPAAALPDWCAGISWLLLDCDDATRQERLRARGWEDADVQAALADAAALRRQVAQQLDATGKTPAEVAEGVLEWLFIQARA